IAEGILEPGLAEDGGMKGAGEHRLRRGGGLRGLADLAPHRIDRGGTWPPLVLIPCAIHGVLPRPRPGSLGPDEAIDTPPGGESRARPLRAQYERSLAGALFELLDQGLDLAAVSLDVGIEIRTSSH